MSPRIVAIAAAVVALLALGWFWLRDSPLVGVDEVTITGVTGPESASIRGALASAARDMTTLHVSEGDLRSAIAAYPQVKDLQLTTHFPHRLDIAVIEHNPVAVIVADGKRVPVAADGRLLRSVPADNLPTIGMSASPGGDRLGDAQATRAVTLLSAAPAALRARVQHVWSGSHGLTARLSRGPLLYFGSTERLDAKWIAVTRVLEDPDAAGALYLDVRIPERTAAGGLAAPSTSQPSTGG